MTLAKPILTAALFFGSILPAAAQTAAEGDWPWWRGPSFNGIAAEGQDVPVKWSDSENVIWKTPVPGRGHSSPTVAGDRVYLSTADERAQVQSVVAFDRKTGKQVWKTDLHRGGFPKIHQKNTHASSSVAFDGERLFIAFQNNDAVHVSALGLDGKKVWQSVISPFKPQSYEYGYAPSPLIYKSLVIIAADEDNGNGQLAAYDRKTGRLKWKAPRPKLLSWSSPVVAKVAGRDQLLISGCEIVASYDPNSGRPLWSTKATTKATCGTMVWQGNMVFASGGYPRPGTYALLADGSRKIVWQSRDKCYEQSMLLHDGYLYAVTDAGVAMCWKAADGTEMWKSRLGGKVSASLVLANGNLYHTNERGTTFVFKADPKGYQEVGQNQLGDSGFATPTICGNRIYIRAGTGSTSTLYCIGKK